MPIVCTSDYTISDFNDAISLSGYISSNLAHTQIYNPDNASYTPNWGTNNLVLTPQLFVTSTSNDIIATAAVTSVDWYINSETSGNKITTGGSYTLSGTKSHIVTVSSNVLAGLNNIKYICVISYHDSTTNLDLTHKMDITFTLINSGSGVVTAVCIATEGNIFKNNSVASLKALCDLYRGSSIDTSNTSYKWAISDATITSSSATGYDSDFGNGWRLLTQGDSTVSGTNTHELTIYPDAVPSLAVFKCIITDTDSTSTTYGGKFFDTVTITDLSDPIQMTIVSSAGDVFLNGQGSTILTARLFRGGAEIDTTSPYTYTYKWYRYDSSGIMDSNFGTNNTSYRPGKTLNVDDSMVSGKATFRCEAE